MLATVGAFAQSSDHSAPDSTTSVWTQQDWVNWWTAIEDLYLNGISEEDLYWQVRLDIEALGYNEPALQNIDFPAPYPGWSGSGGGSGGGDHIKPYGSHAPRERGAEYDGGGYGLQYKCNLGSATRCPRGPDPWDVVEPPPAWVATSIMILGSNLSFAPHPGVKVTGILIFNVGGILMVWIQTENDDE